jgi:hypothetical protein
MVKLIYQTLEQIKIKVNYTYDRQQPFLLLRDEDKYRDRKIEHPLLHAFSALGCRIPFSLV